MSGAGPCEENECQLRERRWCQQNHHNGRLDNAAEKLAVISYFSEELSQRNIFSRNYTLQKFSNKLSSQTVPRHSKPVDLDLEFWQKGGEPFF